MGAGGKVIRIAHINVSTSDSYNGKSLSYKVSEEGTFSFSLPNGWYRFQFSGVDYSATPMIPMEVYCSGEPVGLKAELIANSAPSVVDSVKIITDVTNYAFDKAILMKKEADGTFSAEIKTDKPKLGYQVLVFGGEQHGEHSINGTMSDTYEYDGGGDYRSIINRPNGMVKIIFDPKKLPDFNGEPSVTKQDSPTSTPTMKMKIVTEQINADFTDEFSKSVQNIIIQENADRQKFYTAYSNSKTGKPFNYDPKAIRTGIREEISHESNPLLRELKMLRYIAVGSLDDNETGADAAFVKEILSVIPPFSSVWGHNPRLISVALRLTNDTSGEYLKRVIKDNSSVYVKSEALSLLLEKATNDKLIKLTGFYYDWLMKDFPDTYAARNAQKTLNPNRKVKIGNQIPNFIFDGIEDSAGKKITPALLKGKWVLIDNWATWCGPCVDEMPALHKAYEKFKHKKFVVLSVSFDREAKDVTKFRSGKYKMPWMHSFSEGVWESEAAKVFEVSRIPKPILIDPNGKIVALENDLRSDTLEKTLEKYLK